MKIIYCLIILGLFLLSGQNISAQGPASFNRFADLTGAIGSSQGSVAGSFVYNWRLGKKRKLELGIGGRITSYFGDQKYFITAGPARLTRSFTTPFLIVFAGQKEENFDTLTVSNAFVTAVNASFNAGYHFSPKWYGGMNIDLIGFSFGSEKTASFQSEGLVETEPKAKPGGFNLLLTGDHDKGTLNSEFFIKYQINPQWAIRALYQFLFVEYETRHVEQVAEDGTVITRFRNKANNFGLGIAYHF